MHLSHLRDEDYRGGGGGGPGRGGQLIAGGGKVGEGYIIRGTVYSRIWDSFRENCPTVKML